MFYQQTSAGYAAPAPGITQKTLVYGKHTLMTEFRLKRQSILPLHSHLHEQTGYLVSGRMKLSIGTESVDCRPGDAWCIPANVEHEAEVFEDAVAIEVFSPVREEYLPENASV